MENNAVVEKQDLRSELSKMLVHWSKKNGVSVSYAWGRLAGIIRNTYHVDLFSVAAEDRCKLLDVIDCHGYLQQAIDLAKEWFK